MKKLIVLLALPFFALAALGQEPLKLSFDQAVEMAQKNSVKLKNSELDILLAKQKVREILSNGLPQVSATAQLTYFPEIPVQALPDFISPAVYGVLFKEGLLTPKQVGSNDVFAARFGTTYNGQASATLSQLIFDGTFFLGVQASKSYVQLSEMMLEKSKLDVDSGVTKAYMSVLITGKSLEVLKDGSKRLEKTYADTKELYKNGFVEKLDVDRLELATSNLKAQIDKVQGLYNLVMALFNFQIGAKLDEKVELTTTLEELTSRFAPDDLANSSLDLNNRIEYRILNKSLNLQAYDLKRWKVAYYPSVAAFGNIGYTNPSNTFNYFSGDATWYRSSYLGAQVRIPIFDGFYKDSKIKQAKYTLQQLENTKKNLEYGLGIDAINNKLKYINAQTQLKNQKTSLELAERIYNTSKLKYNEGVGNSFELISAENDFKQAQLNYMNSLYELLNAGYDLKRALGK